MKKVVLLSALLLTGAMGFAQQDKVRLYRPHEDGNNGYYGNHYSPPAMHPAEFARVRDMIARRSFDSDRLTVALQVARSNNLSAVQVADIMGLFSFESTRLEFAKGAYATVVDPHNYYVVNDAFTFSASIDELATYLDGYATTGQVIVTTGNYGVNGYQDPQGPGSCGTTTTVTTYSTGTMTATGGVTTYNGNGNYGHNGYYTNPGPVAICEADFNQIVYSVNSKSFDSDRLRVAKQAIQQRYITAGMVSRLMGLFSFESNRLDFAKFAYHHCVDTYNYYIVNDAFTFSSSIRDLERYIQSH